MPHHIGEHAQPNRAAQIKSAPVVHAGDVNPNLFSQMQQLHEEEMEELRSEFT
jgi:hypothetical protein